MTRWEALSFISDTLRSMLPGRPLSALEAENVSWDVVLELASEHAVTPTLAWALRRADLIPAEVGDYLSITLELNCRRNRNMLDGLELAVAALNSADCQPVLLKGAAALLDEGLYPDVSMRYLCDLDILVPLSRLHDAAIALKRIGFQAVPEPTVPKRWVRPRPQPGHLHHLPPLLYGETGVVIELHRTITLQQFDSLLPATSGIEHQSKRKFRGLELCVLAPTDRIVHNIVHSQLHHGQHKRGAINCANFSSWDCSPLNSVERSTGRMWRAAFLVQVTLRSCRTTWKFCRPSFLFHRLFQHRTIQKSSNDCNRASD